MLDHDPLPAIDTSDLTQEAVYDDSSTTGPYAGNTEMVTVGFLRRNRSGRWHVDLETTRQPRGGDVLP
jgi:hypothetical protein